MNFFHAFILGIVEGISEFLPISSTGHLILASKLLNLPETEFLKSFEIAIQLGAILAVVCLYWRTLLINFEVLKRVLAGFIPTAIVGFVLYKAIKKFLLGNEMAVIVSLALGGVFLILFERFHREKENDTDDLAQLSYSKAVLIGLCQSLAVIPGVSRAAATICGGLFLGLRRKAIVEYSFLLAIPTMAAATALDLLKTSATFSQEEFGLLGVGFVTSFVVAIFSVKFLLNFIKRHNFMLFGAYRITAALMFWVLWKS